jgi:membrane peptidoglycan carboxypeptidase
VIDKISRHLSQFAQVHRHLFVTLVVTLSLVMWAAGGVSAWLLRDVVTDLPDQAAIKNVGSMAQATTLVDVKGRHAFTIFQEQRIEVPLSRMSPHLLKAVVAIEDQRFYDHGGVDVVRVAGAALSNLRARRASCCVNVLPP